MLRYLRVLSPLPEPLSELVGEYAFEAQSRSLHGEPHPQLDRNCLHLHLA